MCEFVVNRGVKVTAYFCRHYNARVIQILQHLFFYTKGQIFCHFNRLYHMMLQGIFTNMNAVAKRKYILLVFHFPLVILKIFSLTKT